MEDEDNNIHLKNLTLHQATNEEEALNLLFLGDTNRMIAEVIFCILTKINLNTFFYSNLMQTRGQTYIW